MRAKIVIFCVSLLIWLGLTWSLAPVSVAVGAVVALLATFLTWDMFNPRFSMQHFPTRTFWFLVYIPMFFWECFKANLDVAYRVSHPTVPIHPGIVKVKTLLKSDLGITFLANSITLTPGTLSVDVDRDEGYIYVHWIEVKHKDPEGATRDIIRRFEPIIRRIFE